MSHPIEKAHPFNAHRLWGDEKYSLQNMLMRQVMFPFHAAKDDQTESQWTDRNPELVQAAGQKYLRKFQCSFESGDSLRQLSPEEFLAFCQEATGIDWKPTGARIVRYTNAASGYPTYRIDCYAPKDGKDYPCSSSNHPGNVILPDHPMTGRLTRMFPWQDPEEYLNGHY